MLAQYIVAWGWLTLPGWTAMTLLPGPQPASLKDGVIMSPILEAVDVVLGHMVVLLFGVEDPVTTGMDIFILRSIVTASLLVVIQARAGLHLTFSSHLLVLGWVVVMSCLGATLQYML